MPDIVAPAYKANVEDVLARLQSLYGRSAGNGIFVTMDAANRLMKRVRAYKTC